MTVATLTGIPAKDWREFVRDRRLLLMAAMVALLAFAAVAVALAQVRAYEADRAATVHATARPGNRKGSATRTASRISPPGHCVR
jgi:hypothetical protein